MFQIMVVVYKQGSSHHTTNVLDFDIRASAEVAYNNLVNRSKFNEINNLAPNYQITRLYN